MTNEEMTELLTLLFIGKDDQPPELLLGRVGPGEGVPSWGLLKHGIVHTRPASKRGAALAEQFVQGAGQ